MIRSGGALPLQGSREHREIGEFPVCIFNRRGNGILSQRDSRASRIQHADRFVRELPSCQIALREPNGGRHGFFQNANAVMFFQRGRHAAQHQHACGFIGLLHLHHLKAARQSGIALEIFLVLGPGSSGDGAQFASAPERASSKFAASFCPGLAARADHRVRFVDEENDRRRRCLGLFDQGLEPILKFPLDPRARLQKSEVQRQNFYILQRRWNLASERLSARSPLQLRSFRPPPRR